MALSVSESGAVPKFMVYKFSNVTMIYAAMRPQNLTEQPVSARTSSMFQLSNTTTAISPWRMTWLDLIVMLQAIQFACTYEQPKPRNSNNPYGGKKTIKVAIICTCPKGVPRRSTVSAHRQLCVRIDHEGKLIASEGGSLNCWYTRIESAQHVPIRGYG